MTSPTRRRAPATPDAGLRRPVERSRDLALVAVFAALVCALALTPGIPIGLLAIPITLQTLGIMLCGALLGPWRGAAAAALYLVVGAVGIPVFAGGGAGLGSFAGASAGFLISYPFAALVVGLLARRGVRRGHPVAGLVAGALVGGILVVYAFGILGMAWGGGLSLTTAATLCLGYVPGDLVKVVLAVLVAAPVHRAFPRLTAR